MDGDNRLLLLCGFNSFICTLWAYSFPRRYWVATIRACLQRHLIALPVVLHHDWPQSRPFDTSDLRRVYLLSVTKPFRAVLQYIRCLFSSKTIESCNLIYRRLLSPAGNIPCHAATFWLFLTRLDVSVLTSSISTCRNTVLFWNYLKLLCFALRYYNIITQERGDRDSIYRLGKFKWNFQGPQSSDKVKTLQIHSN